MKVLAFSGSNSAFSINQELIKYSTQFLHLPCDIMDLRNYEIPMFSIDEEEQNGFSNELIELYNNLTSYDAYIIAIPEHNGNFSSFFKNIIDWLTRVDRGFFKDKPILLLNAAPGPNGGKSVLSNAEKTFSFFSGNVIGTFVLPQYHSFIINGKIVIEKAELITELNNVIEKLENSLKYERVSEEKRINTINRIKVYRKIDFTMKNS